MLCPQEPCRKTGPDAAGAEMLCPHEGQCPHVGHCRDTAFQRRLATRRSMQDRQGFAIVVFCHHDRHVDRSGKSPANCKTGPDAAGAEMLCPQEPTTYKCCVPVSVTVSP
jgi:hypothetical protein